MTDKTEQTDPRVTAMAERLMRAGHWVKLSDQRISEKSCAVAIGVTTRTMQRWRKAGIAPPFVMVGKNPTYRLVDLLEWLDSRRHDPRTDWH